MSTDDGEASDQGLPKGSKKKFRRRARRPKQEQAVKAQLLMKIMSERVTVTLTGERKRITRWEALIRALMAQAINKNTSATKLLHQIRTEFPPSKPPEQAFIWVVSDADLRC